MNNKEVTHRIQRALVNKFSREENMFLSSVRFQMHIRVPTKPTTCTITFPISFTKCMLDLINESKKITSSCHCCIFLFETGNFSLYIHMYTTTKVQLPFKSVTTYRGRQSSFSANTFSLKNCQRIPNQMHTIFQFENNSSSFPRHCSGKIIVFSDSVN